ncbi:MAG TPA: hypothetical protein VGQ49_06410 [Bryobacteraceae bacterium]|nr:hypothetical protein [Bryobacteraceae bacterium]
MVTTQYRRWCPPQSLLRIEFPPELLHDVRLSSAPPVRSIPLRWIPRLNRAVTQSGGLLFGVRQENEVRVLAAHANEHPDGLDPVGIFVWRERGEVFLTDDDLANFEKHQGVLALVIAGGQAGFFVRESDGSVQAIRSHEEFKVADAVSRPASGEMDTADEVPAPASRGWQYAWKRMGACAALLAVPAGAFAYLRPLLPSLPLALAIREEAGQLVIGWNAGALAGGGRLEIQDGGKRTILMLPADASGATYGRQGDEVEVRLSTDTRIGGAHWEAARFVSKSPRPATASSALQDRIGALRVEAEELRRSLASGQARTRELGVKLAAATRER